MINENSPNNLHAASTVRRLRQKRKLIIAFDCVWLIFATCCARPAGEIRSDKDRLFIQVHNNSLIINSVVRFLRHSLDCQSFCVLAWSSFECKFRWINSLCCSFSPLRLAANVVFASNLRDRTPCADLGQLKKLLDTKNPMTPLKIPNEFN